MFLWRSKKTSTTDVLAKGSRRSRVSGENFSHGTRNCAAKLTTCVHPHARTDAHTHTRTRARAQVHHSQCLFFAAAAARLVEVVVCLTQPKGASSQVDWREPYSGCRCFTTNLCHTSRQQRRAGLRSSVVGVSSCRGSGYYNGTPRTLRQQQQQQNNNSKAIRFAERDVYVCVCVCVLKTRNFTLPAEFRIDFLRFPLRLLKRS